MRAILMVVITSLLAPAATAETYEVIRQTVTEWKPVYGQVATRHRVPARARIAGTVRLLEVSEGDRVEAGDRIAVIEDDKLQFQIGSIDAQVAAAQAELETAQIDLDRGEQLLDRGVITAQRLDQLRTQVQVLQGQIARLASERQIIGQQIEEGAVLAPESGVVLTVPIALGSVVTPGEAIAEIGGGGAFLRLAVPERFAEDLQEGDILQIGQEDDMRRGELVKLYPLVEGGRVQADVEVDGLDTRFVGRRLSVRLPVAERAALLVPEDALIQVGGLDFVTVRTDRGPLRRSVVPGERIEQDGRTWREILSGLQAGDIALVDHE